MARRDRANLTIAVDADTAAARRELRSFSRRTGAWAGVTAAAATGAWNAAVAGAGQVINLLGDSVDAAATLAAETSTTAIRFGQSADEMVAWAEASANAMGLSTQEALEAANGFAVFGEVMGLNERELDNWARSMVEGATELAALNNVPVSETVATMTSAFRGNTEVLDNLGVVANEATLKMQYMALTGEEVTGTLTPQQKTMAINSLLMEEMGDAAGAWAADAEGLIGQQQIVGAQWADLQAQIGEELLPIMVELFDWIMNDLVPALEEWWQAIEPVVQELVDRLTPAIEDLAEWIEDDLVPAIQDLARWLEANLVPALTEVWDYLQSEVIPAIQDFVDALMDAWAAVDQDVIPVLEFLARLLGPILGAALLQITTLFKVWTAALRTGTAVYNGVRDAILGIARAFQDLWGWINSVISALGRISWPSPPGWLSDVGGFLGLGRSSLVGVPGSQSMLRAGADPYSRTTSINYNLTVSAPIGTTGADVGAAIVQHIVDWEARNGTMWRDERY